jgi:hypothetical protein
MCECVKGEDIVAGWSCHHCHIYNGLQRPSCKNCRRARCAPLAPNKTSGKQFETYEEAYRDDPEMLARVRLALGRS